MRFTPGCQCCNCNPINVKIAGKVFNSCFYPFGYPGIFITTTGTDTLSTTTAPDGTYSLPITKRGTYQVTAHLPCGDETQSVEVPTCTSHANVSFTAAGKLLKIVVTADCEADPLPVLYYAFTRRGEEPTSRPALPGALPYTGCLFPGDYSLTIIGNPCYEDEIIPITMGCSDVVIDHHVIRKLRDVPGKVKSCLGWGSVDNATVSWTGPAGSGTTTSAGDGSFTMTDMKAGCDFTLTVSKGPKYLTSITNRSVNCDATVMPQDVQLEASEADGWYCAGLCCWHPVKFTILDEQGMHVLGPSDVVTGTLFGSFSSECITADSKPAAAQVIDAGFFGGIICYPEPVEIEERTIAYKYVVACFLDPSDPTFNTGVWRCTRMVPGCTIRPGGTTAVAQSACVDNFPRSSPVTAYLSETVDIPSSAPGCSPTEFTVSGSLGDLGDWTVISE